MILLNAAAYCYMAYESLGFRRRYLFLIRKSESKPYGREVFVTDGERGSDSAGTGGASIPNCSHHPTGDLLTQGSFILDFFRLTPKVLFTSETGTEY